MFWFDKFLEPVVVVSHTEKNYFDWALSDWAIKANVWVLTFGPLCISSGYFSERKNLSKRDTVIFGLI